ncbi:hypothetical protein [Microbulbifer aestuariivivens]|uniref:hypothetical protein n=1 Tax=Microbulbifer aestuariivivens TaxID=1908308 RepID=UPI0031ED0D29
MVMKQQKSAFTIMLLFSSLASAAGNKCPFPEKYIEIDRAYHQCVNGHVRTDASCEAFLERVVTLFPRYNCTRSFDTEPVPAIWLFDAVSEDYIKLIYELATKSNPIFEGQWFVKESAQAKKIFLSPEFKSVLDGHMAEDYYPLIESVQSAP